MVDFEELKGKRSQIAVVGLGYVGLPLALALSKHFSVIGFDIKKQRIEELKKGEDKTRETQAKDLKESEIFFTSEESDLKNAQFVIVAVPTPVKEVSVPDMSLVEKATATVGRNLIKDSVVVFESTVYPGATEEICLPILEKASGMKAGVDFKIGYSPERINPGDKTHVIEKVVKVVAGMDEEALELIASVYGTITQVFKAKSIKVAEAAKVIENTQRDLNIALMNELSKIFIRMGISIYDVLAAAGTKWNFLKFTPGLVGGHCIGVDPYYLTYKAQELGYQPEVILSGRKINDSMGSWLTDQILDWFAIKKPNIQKPSILIVGITFKENVPDIRNSKVVDIYKELKNKGLQPEVYDPIAESEEVFREYGINLVQLTEARKYDLLVLAVPHEGVKIKKLDDWGEFLNPEGCLADIKGIYHNTAAEHNKLINYWTL